MSSKRKLDQINEIKDESNNSVIFSAIYFRQDFIKVQITKWKYVFINNTNTKFSDYSDFSCDIDISETLKTQGVLWNTFNQCILPELLKLGVQNSVVDETSVIKDKYINIKIYKANLMLQRLEINNRTLKEQIAIATIDGKCSISLKKSIFSVFKTDPKSNTDKYNMGKVYLEALKFEVTDLKDKPDIFLLSWDSGD